MAYSVIKVWIPGEVLTASNLNTEFSGKITNENDLDTRLTTEVTTRGTLETEFDTLAGQVWNTDHIKENTVTNASMADDSVNTDELVDGAVTGDKVHGDIKDPAAGTAGLRTLGTGAAQALPGNTDLNATAHTGDVTGTTSLTIGSAKVTQSMLKTSIGSVGAIINANAGVNYTLPGGQYGFYPQTKIDADNILVYMAYGGIGSTYATNIGLYNDTAGNRTLNAQQRYVTASGEIHWIFILRDKNTKEIQGMYQAPDHPCFGNGGKPLLTPHPFGSYDEAKYEIIVINPTNEEIEQMELETIVDDETKPDKDLLEVITENYEIDENSNPAWPTKPVTVGLPKHIKDKTGKKILADYRFMGKDDIVEPIKKVIPKPDYIKVKKLKKK